MKTSKRATRSRLKKAIKRAQKYGRLAEAAKFQQQLDELDRQT